MTRFVSVPVFLVLATTCFAQGKTWIVDQVMRPGAHYKDIPAALAKAVDGDKVVVRSGVYTPFTLSRGVTIIGQPGVTFSSPGQVSIRNVPAGRTAAVHKLTLADSLIVDKCKGRVILDWLRIGKRNMLVQDSPQVYLFDCRMSSLQIWNSRLIAVKSYCYPAWANPTVAVTINKSEVTMAGCTAVGGLGGKAGISLDASSVLTLTDDGSSIGIYAGAIYGPSTAIVGSGTIVLDPRVKIVSYNGAPKIAKGIKVVRRTVPYLDVRGAQLGGTVYVTMKAGANHPFFLAVGLPGNVTSIPSLGGSVWLDLNTAILIATGKLDVNGVYAWSIPVPRNNVLLGLALVWQGTAGASVGQQSLSNPSAYVHGF